MDDNGLFDDVPLMNRERDRAWEQFIKRKDISNLFTDNQFGFPLNGGYYDLWSICWAKAWDKGFMAGWESRSKEDAKPWRKLTKEEAADLWSDAHDIDGNMVWTPEQLFDEIDRRLQEKNT